MHFFDNVFLVDENKAVKTELLLAGGGEVVFVALVDDFVPELAHVADANLDKSDGGAFVEGELFGLFWGLLFQLGLLLLGRLIY